MLIGLVVVFVGLILLIICVKIMDKLVNKSEEGKPAAPAPAPAAPAPVSAPQVEAGISPEVLAAITAAICATRRRANRSWCALCAARTVGTVLPAKRISTDLIDSWRVSSCVSFKSP